MRFVRWTKTDDKFFIHGNCRAEMKKSVAYDVDLQLDNNGNVRQSQCECAAGMGPAAHCKHVVCLLFTLVKLNDSGKLNTELSCTEKLQSFHRAKPYTGSPVKLYDVASGKSVLRFDPRPSNLQNMSGYDEFVKNMAVNYSLYFSRAMPLLQLIEPANPFAIRNDHSYSTISVEDHLLQHLKVNRILQSECEVLELSTRGQSHNQKWCKERIHRLHSSRFGRICKATDRTDKDALAKSLTCHVKLNVPSLKYGRTFEKVAVEQYETLMSTTVNECGIFVRPEYPYVASSPDGIVNSDLLIEVKCPYTSRDKTIDEVSVPYLIKESNGKLNLRRDHDYFYQIQGQLFCSNRKLCHLVVYTKKDLQVILVERDDAFITTMLAKLELFFEQHFKVALLNKYIYRDYYSYTFSNL